jgi:hypothetical protein
MLDGSTYEHGAALGFDGVDFYFAGRGGALGEVSGAVLAAALVFFEPARVAAAWDRGRAVLPPSESARAWSQCAERWAQSHLPDGVDYRQLAEILGVVVEGASAAGAPLFAAWAAEPEPPSPKALALHRLNLLRELRGALHGAAVLAQGLSPLEALAVRTPLMAEVFGWGDVELPDAAVHKEAWRRAEEGTDRAMSRHLGVLDETQLQELVELCGAAQGAVPTS